MPRTVLGVDPGLSGALSLYDPLNNALRVEDMPTLTLKRNGKLKREIDVHRLCAIVAEMAAGEPAVFVENSTPMPDQGAASTFAFGKNFGILLGVLSAHKLVLERVAPLKWKNALHVPKEKDGARARASALMPKHAHYWPRVKDDGRAESALIALYGAGLLGQGRGL